MDIKPNLCIYNKFYSSFNRFIKFQTPTPLADLRGCYALADLGGREGRTPPPGRPNSFDFMQFSGKFGVFTPPLEGSCPPSGKSWIRHCYGYPLSPISFIFMQFLAKILPNNRFLPAHQRLVPPI